MSYRTASSTGGIITAEVELLRSRLFAMSSTHLLTRTDEHMYDATVLQQSKHRLLVFSNMMLS